MADTVYSAFVGLGVHKDSISVAIAYLDRGAEVRFYGTINNEQVGVDRLLKRLSKNDKSILVCYEAGPCGYRLYRQIVNHGIDCQVVAPSRIPRSPTDRIKNDHRDAIALARLLRATSLLPSGHRIRRMKLCVT